MFKKRRPTDRKERFEKKDFRDHKGDSKGERGSGGRRPFRRSPKYQLPKDSKIDYKNYTLLQKFVTERGKIVTSRLSGVSAKEQRKLSQAIKLARNLALLSGGGSKGI